MSPRLITKYSEYFTIRYYGKELDKIIQRTFYAYSQFSANILESAYNKET